MTTKTTTTRSAPGRRTRDPIGKRRQIVTAAIKLFARQGFERTTTREIAEAAGVAEGTLYIHFPSKNDILFAFFKGHALEPVFAILEEAGEQDEYDVLQTLVRNRIAMFKRVKDVARIMFGEAMFNPKMAALLSHELRLGQQRVKAFVEERIRAGRFRPLDADAVARLVMSMFFGTFFMWGFIAGDYPKRFTPEQLIATLPEIMLHGLQADRPLPSRPARARCAQGGSAKSPGGPVEGPNLCAATGKRAIAPRKPRVSRAGL